MIQPLAAPKPWIDMVRDEMQAERPADDTPSKALQFFYRYWAMHHPGVVALDDWPLMSMNLDDIEQLVGSDALVQVQSDRDADPEYEFNSPQHRHNTTFGGFVRRLKSEGNNVYMTAQNATENSATLSPLYAKIGVLPSFLTPYPANGFLWIGKDTLTPLHHDETNNLMCQTMGTKIVRLFAPEEREKLDPWVGVHSRLKWVDDDMIRDRGIREWNEVVLTPGKALFLPIGWWHCVKSVGVSMTVVYTNFIWTNFWGRVY